MGALPARSLDAWRSPTRPRGKPGPLSRVMGLPHVVEVIDRSWRETVRQHFPDMWEDLSDEGRDTFLRALMEAAARSPEDRLQAGVDVVDSWYQVWRLLYAPEDDEPYTEEEQAEDASA